MPSEIFSTLFNVLLILSDWENITVFTFASSILNDTKNTAKNAKRLTQFFLKPILAALKKNGGAAIRQNPPRQGGIYGAW
jgi:hypothetical protein